MPKEKTKSDNPIKLTLQIVSTKKLAWRSIKDFQPEGFKKGTTNGLRQSLIENGILDRFKVFTIKGSTQIFMFDGHTRKTVMQQIELDGKYNFDIELETDFLEFANKKEAAIALLQYQAGKLKITKSGLSEFAEIVQLADERVYEIVEGYGIELAKEPKESETGYWKVTIWKLEIRFENESEAQQVYNDLMLNGIVDMKIKAVKA